jgi:phage I-like protein
VFEETFAPIGGVPIDLDHSFAEGGTSEAVGWIKQLFVEGDKLMARAEWTDEGASLIAAGKFRLFSPEFSTNWTDEQGKARGFTLLAGGITNRPFLKGLAPVALSERAIEFVASEAVQMAQLAEMFRVPAPVAPAPKDAPDMSEPTVTAKDVEDLTAQLSEAREQAETFKSEIQTLAERVTAAEGRAEATQKELDEERLTAVLTQARREGRIDAKDETTQEFAEMRDSMGLDTVKKFIAKLPPETIPMSETGHGHDKPEIGTAPEGVDEPSHRAHVRAEQIAEEKGISYEEAAPLAFKEVYG